MFPVLVSLCLGVVVGVLLRRREKALKIVDRLTTWFVYIFLFLLGLTVGLNREIIADFGRLGIQAAAIAVCCVAGSVLPAFFIYRFLYARKKP